MIRSPGKLLHLRGLQMQTLSTVHSFVDDLLLKYITLLGVLWKHPGGKLLMLALVTFFTGILRLLAIFVHSSFDTLVQQCLCNFKYVTGIKAVRVIFVVRAHSKKYLSN